MTDLMTEILWILELSAGVRNISGSTGPSCTKQNCHNDSNLRTLECRFFSRFNLFSEREKEIGSSHDLDGNVTPDLCTPSDLNYSNNTLLILNSIKN